MPAGSARFVSRTCTAPKHRRHDEAEQQRVELGWIGVQLLRDGGLRHPLIAQRLEHEERASSKHACVCQHSCAGDRLGAVSFLYRFGAALDAHVHFHCCVLDGVFLADH